ncbi:MAG: HutD family protein [Dongiaceae bacterium]
MLRRLTPADYRSMPWANGRGTTLEYAREEDGEGWLWRLSRAAVVEPGPFSPLPGLDRVLLLLEGPGFTLDLGPAGRVRVSRPLQPVRFSGDWPVAAIAVDGPSQDLNLMTARRRVTAALAVLRETAPAAPAGARCLALALAGAWRIALPGAAVALAAGELALASGEAGRALACDGTGILVRIDLAIAP